jgi:exodeoxyribonuclease III
MKYRLLSWNVNGIRAAQKKGFVEWALREKPDVLAVQETKARPEQLSDALKNIPGYRSYWCSAQKPGYSGTAIYTRHEPIAVEYGLGIKKFDQEGRTIIAEFKDFLLYNIYYPNGKKDDERLRFKMDFYDAFLEHARKRLKKGKTVIVCGDVNTAHKDIDLARPDENRAVSGFLPEECAWIDRFLEAGFVDTLREFDREPGRYTWWDLKSGARVRNVGWRIDYFFIDAASRARLKDAFIMPDVAGSDHCPVGIVVS